MDSSTLAFALKISGIGIVVLLLVLVLLAVVVGLMTRFIVDKPEKKEETVEEISSASEALPEGKSNLEVIAAIALAIARGQAETQSVQSLTSAGEVNSWRQFNLQRRLNQSSNIRRTR